MAYDAEYHKEYRRVNKESIALKQRARWLKNQYKMTLEEYDRMFEEQGGVCRICGKAETQIANNGLVKMLAVDHDHSCCPERSRSCGECTRGLLCGRCNQTLGAVGDDVTLIAKMIIYLKGKR